MYFLFLKTYFFFRFWEIPKAGTFSWNLQCHCYCQYKTSLNNHLSLSNWYRTTTLSTDLPHLVLKKSKMIGTTTMTKLAQIFLSLVVAGTIVGLPLALPAGKRAFILISNLRNVSSSVIKPVQLVYALFDFWDLRICQKKSLSLGKEKYFLIVHNCHWTDTLGYQVNPLPIWFSKFIAGFFNLAKWNASLCSRLSYA